MPPVVQRWWKDVKEYEEGRVRVLKPRLCRFDSCNLGKKFFLSLSLFSSETGVTRSTLVKGLVVAQT